MIMIIIISAKATLSPVKPEFDRRKRMKARGGRLGRGREDP
jgi:hypothetical protein